MNKSANYFKVLELAMLYVLLKMWRSEFCFLRLIELSLSVSGSVQSRAQCIEFLSDRRL